MTELEPWAEQRLADMTPEEFDALRARVRPPEEDADPKIAAAKALRRSRGLDRTGTPSKESAAAALRLYGGGSRTN